MCGIAGIFNGTLSSGDYVPLLRRMANAMRHRGPDEDGLIVVSGMSAGLACCRLSLVDLHGGHQPMPNEDESIHVAFNGEIYNHHDLRDELTARGHQFRSVCDAEVIVHLYEECGVDGLDRLEGMFAVAILDNRRRRLLLARDKTGMKSLYWTLAPSGLLFASELRTLFASNLCAPEADLVAMRTMLDAGFVPAPLTGFKGLRKLPPGGWLMIDTDGIREGRYWLPHFHVARASRAEDELAVELRTVLDRATASHLRADVPVGLFLSGGLDSSLLALLAARHTEARLKTFSIVFPEDTGADERTFSRMVAGAIGSDHHEIAFYLHDLPDLYTAVMRQIEEPSMRSPFVLQHLLAKRAACEVKAVLSGEGADELFGGYPWLRNPLFSMGEALHGMVPRSLARRLAQRITGDRTGRVLRLLAAADRDGMDLEWLRGLFPPTAHTYINPDVLAVEPAVQLLLPTTDTGASCGDRLQRRLALEMIHRLPEGILMPCDKVTMAHSLEVRMPFLDSKVVAFALGLPSRWKIRGDIEKYLVKKVAVGLPPEIAGRRKFSLRYCSNGNVSHTVRAWARELLYDSKDPCPLLLHDAIKKALDTPEEYGPTLSGCWCAINLQCWWNAFFSR